jgi:ribose transport system permease protein
MENIEKQGVVKKLLKIRGMGQVITVTLGLIILCIVFGILNPTFFSSQNVGNLLRQIAPILIIGIGQSYVLITGNIDLSIGSVVGMSCMISATMMTKGATPLTAVIVTLICCLILGVINGALVAKCKLPPFIGTLGTMTIARGIAQIVNNNYNTDSIGDAARGFRDFFYYGKTLGLYNTIWIAVAIWIVFNFILSKTRTGRHIYAIGSNVEAAKLSGVNIASTTTKAYLVSAFCACIVGLSIAATSGMGTMDAGNSYEMYAVAASVIGGVSTLGGQGILLGTIIGASIWGVLQNGLQFVGAPVAIRNIVIGIIVVVSVLLDIILRSGKLKRTKLTNDKKNMVEVNEGRVKKL